MIYKKICAGILLLCLAASGCGQGGNGDSQSQSIEIFATKESTDSQETGDLSKEEETNESPAEDTSLQDTESVSGASADGEQDSKTSGESGKEETDETVKDDTYRSELFEFHVTIGQTEYTLPEKFQTFLDKEWGYDGDKELELNPNEYVADEAIYKNNHLLYVSFVNLGYDIQKLQNCSIGSILFDQIALKDANTNIILAGGIKYGESSKEDIIKAYGTPDNEENSDTESILTYEESDYSKVVFTVNKKKNVITDILLTNFTPSVDDLNISKDTLEIVSSYSAPKELGSNLQKPVLSFDGANYQLPAPVSAFLDNGWKLAEDAYDAVAARKSCTMHLEKGDYRIKIKVVNFTDEAQYLNNCFVTWLETNKTEDRLNVSMELPGKIKTGMSEADLIKALGDTAYKKDEKSDEKYITYDVTYEGKSGKVRLYVLKENPVLWRIVAENQPDEIK